MLVFSSELLYRAMDRRRRDRFRRSKDRVLSWNAAAKEMGVSRWALHRIAHDRTKPREETMAKILKWLQLPDETNFMVREDDQLAIEEDFFHLQQR